MEDMDDCGLAGAFIKSEQEYIPGLSSTQDFIKATGSSSSTIYKLFDGYFGVRQRTIVAIERTLRWPLGSILAIRQHDLQALEDKHFPPDALDRLRDMMGDQGQATA
jgi:hypothetical protein